MKLKEKIPYRDYVKLHRKYWLLEWVIAACNKTSNNLSVDMVGMCYTPDGYIWNCKGCRYNRYRLKKEVMAEQRSE